jgi:hypothetical protein
VVLGEPRPQRTLHAQSEHGLRNEAGRPGRVGPRGPRGDGLAPPPPAADGGRPGRRRHRLSCGRPAQSGGLGRRLLARVRPRPAAGAPLQGVRRQRRAAVPVGKPGLPRLRHRHHARKPRVRPHAGRPLLLRQRPAGGLGLARPLLRPIVPGPVSDQIQLLDPLGGGVGAGHSLRVRFLLPRRAPRPAPPWRLAPLAGRPTPPPADLPAAGRLRRDAVRPVRRRPHLHLGRPNRDDRPHRHPCGSRLRLAAAARPPVVAARRPRRHRPAPAPGATADRLVRLPAGGLVPLAAPPRGVPLVNHLHPARPGRRPLALAREPQLLLGAFVAGLPRGPGESAAGAGPGGAGPAGAAPLGAGDDGGLRGHRGRRPADELPLGQPRPLPPLLARRHLGRCRGRRGTGRRDGRRTDTGCELVPARRRVSPRRPRPARRGGRRPGRLAGAGAGGVW